MTRLRVLPALIIAAVVISLAAVGCGPGGSTGSQAPSPTASASGGEVPDVISAEAVIVPYREASLTFSTGGRVQKMSVSEGDTVAAGQELATLETRDLELAVNQAQAALTLAQAQLAKAKAGALPEQVSVAQADVSVATANVSSATASLDSAKASLKKATAGPTALQLQIAQKQVELANNQLWGAQNQLAAVGGLTLMTPPQASGADYEAAKANVGVAGTQVEIANLQLEQLKAGTREEDLAVIRAQVSQAESAVEIAKAQLEKAKAQLGLVKAGARAEDIAVAEAPVAQAQVGLEQAKNALANAVLTAPFSATVGTILVHEGESAAPQAPVLTVGDVSILRVRTLDLGEADVNQLQVGQAAVVTVDALGGKKLAAKVASIAPLATERRGDTVYAVTLDLDVGAASGLRWGMNAYVEITVR
jgi:HlyD family secretion protein